MYNPKNYGLHAGNIVRLYRNRYHSPNRNPTFKVEYIMFEVLLFTKNTLIIPT